MTFELPATNRVRARRQTLGLTQAELAQRAGISRTAVTAIEGDQLTPSVAAAISIARVLDATVEDLFASESSSPSVKTWAWEPTGKSTSAWCAEVQGKSVLYPTSSTPMLTMLPDDLAVGSCIPGKMSPNQTLVLACCDPAAGILASHYAAMTGLRLLVLPRSSQKSLELLKAGLVHLAGVHLSTRDEPDRNLDLIRDMVGAGYSLIRMARWQEGIALRASEKPRSIKSLIASKLSWVGREPGSGARRCLDQLLSNKPRPKHLASDHRGVVEAVRSGWADAGICVQLASAEAGLSFVPIQDEAFDVCYVKSLADDRRVKAFVDVVRSARYRQHLGELPGYDARETGTLCGES